MLYNEDIAMRALRAGARIIASPDMGRYKIYKLYQGVTASEIAPALFKGLSEKGLIEQQPKIPEIWGDVWKLAVRK